MRSGIDYGFHMHRALRGLIRDVLAEVQKHGLPGAHHFYITFDTRHPNVIMPKWLNARYPQEMTIVLQHWFEDLEVDEQGFAVTLNFGNQPERLYIPFNAVSTFVDPSVEFGLKFETDRFGLESASQSDMEASEAEGTETSPSSAQEQGPRQSAEVVQLDKFRK